MKLQNRIMSWVLSPGAYAVWHSMGAVEEWQIDGDALVHKTTQIQVNVIDYRPHVPAFIGAPITFLIGSFVLDCEGPYKGAIGYFERHLIAGRAFRLQKKLHRRHRTRRRRSASTDVFKKLMVNE